MLFCPPQQHCRNSVLCSSDTHTHFYLCTVCQGHIWGCLWLPYGWKTNWYTDAFFKISSNCDISGIVIILITSCQSLKTHYCCIQSTCAGVITLGWPGDFLPTLLRETSTPEGLQNTIVMPKSWSTSHYCNCLWKEGCVSSVNTCIHMVLNVYWIIYQ